MLNNFQKIIRNRDLFNIFILGIASGLPLALIFSTLSVWLKELELSKTAIGLFALTTTPYIFKFLWSPFIDGLKLPILTKMLGIRKSWLIFSQLLLFMAIMLLGLSQPQNYLYLTALLTLIVSFLSATQDIVIDAYRIEILPENQQGVGATMLVYGYRIGMLISGAGALILADIIPFSLTYILMGSLYILFMVFSFFIKAPKQKREKPKDYPEWFRLYVIAPFENFLEKENWLFIIIFIMLFKLGDAFAGVMTNPFLLELNYSKTEIASIVKIFGLAATLVGTLIGGILWVKYNFKICLMVAGILQMVTNLIFCVQASIGYDLFLLAVTIGAENLAGGLGTAIFVAYLSSLCNFKFTATQYALLSSLASVSRTWFSSSSGFFADSMNWVEFFLFSTVLAVPGIIMIMFLKEQNENRSFERS